MSGTRCTRLCFIISCWGFWNPEQKRYGFHSPVPVGIECGYLFHVLGYFSPPYVLSASCAPHILPGKVVLAPGWSSGSYALQILHRSPAFVVGIKNSCAVITDLNRMRLRGPGHAVKSLFTEAKKCNRDLFFMWRQGTFARRAKPRLCCREVRLPPHGYPDIDTLIAFIYRCALMLNYTH